MSTKLELHIRSLIAHCEELVKDDTNNWILKKYVKSLDTMIQELESSNEYRFFVLLIIHKHINI